MSPSSAPGCGTACSSTPRARGSCPGARSGTTSASRPPCARAPRTRRSSVIAGPSTAWETSEMALKFGVWLPTYAWPDAGPEHVRRVRTAVEKCEQYGFDVWVIDHVLSAPGLYGVAWLEPLTTLAYAAALTRKVRVATGILVLPVRHPVVLAKEIATLAHLADGRYVFGVGPGWYAREF